MMKRILIVGIVGVLGTVVVLSGCSSDNGVARPLSTTLRAVQVGDYYEYTIRGSATHPDVEPEDAPPVSGTVRVSVSNSELRILNEPILRFEYITTLRIGTELRESRFALHYLQGRNPRDLLLIAYEDTQGQIQPITPQIIAVPGLWSAGYSRSYSEPFVYSFIITGQDVVNTPLGKFTTWRCYVRSQVPMDDPIENAVRTVWYAPEIGMPVAVQLTTTIVVGQQTWTVSLHQQLSFTTVPIPDTNL